MTAVSETRTTKSAIALHKLSTFFQDNGHDILEFWLDTDYTILWIQVVSAGTGEFCLVYVAPYRLRMESSEEWSLRKYQQYILYKEEDMYTPEDDSSPWGLYVQLWNYLFHKKNPSGLEPSTLAIPNVLLFYEDHVFAPQSQTLYRGHNLPRRNCLSFYVVLDMEWFYENTFVVAHEVHRQYERIGHDLQSFTKTMLDQFHIVLQPLLMDSLIQLYQQQYTTLCEEVCEYQTLYKNVTQSFSDTLSTLHTIDDTSNPFEYTFQNAVHRQFLRKRFHDKKTKLETLRNQVLLNLKYTFQQRWDVLLRLVLLFFHVMLPVQTIHSIVHEAHRQQQSL